MTLIYTHTCIHTNKLHEWTLLRVYVWILIYTCVSLHKYCLCVLCVSVSMRKCVIYIQKYAHTHVIRIYTRTHIHTDKTMWVAAHACVCNHGTCTHMSVCMHVFVYVHCVYGASALMCRFWIYVHAHTRCLSDTNVSVSMNAGVFTSGIYTCMVSICR